MADKQDAKALAVTLAAGLEKDLGAVSAYAIAVEHGYEGTEEEWAAEMQKALNSVDESAASAQAAKESADAAAQSASTAESAAGEAAAEAAQKAAEDILPSIEGVISDTVEDNLDGVAIERTTTGEQFNLEDSSGATLKELKIYGRATQDGTPSSEAPVDIVVAGSNGSVGINFCDHSIENLQTWKNLTYDHTCLIRIGDGGFPIKKGQKIFLVAKVKSDGNSEIYINNRCGIFSREQVNISKGENLIIRNTVATNDLIFDGGKALDVLNKSPTSDGIAVSCEAAMIGLGEYDGQEIIGFNPQKINISTPTGLPAVPVESGGNYTDAEGQQWICDYIDFESGKYVQCVKIIELLSSFNWTISNNGRNIYYSFSGISLENNKFIISNYFRNGVWDQNEAGIINAGNGFTPAIALSTIDFPTVESLKTWLDEKKSEGKPCYAIYRLEKPVETNLSAEEIAAYKALHTNKNITNIFSDTDPQVGMSLTYAVDTEGYLDKYYYKKDVIDELQRSKADAIVETVSGESLHVDDASGNGLHNLKVFGKATQDGTPTPESPVPVEVAGSDGSVGINFTGANILPYPYFDGMTKTNRGITFTVNEDRSIHITGTATGIASFFLWRNPVLDPSKIVWVFAQNVNGITFEYSNFVNKSYESNEGEPLKITDFFDKKEFPDTTLSVRVKTGKTVDVTIYPMMNYGESPLPYKPYTEQTLTVSTPNGLPGIPVESGGNYTDAEGQQWISDYIDYERGKYVQCVNVFSTKNVRNIPDSETETKWYLVFHVVDSSLNGKSTSSVKYVMTDNIKLVEQPEENNYDIPVMAPYGHANNLEFRYRMPKAMYTTAEDAVDAVKDGIVLYPLATPVETDLSDDEIAAYKALHTNKLVTNVFGDSDPQVGIQMDYGADTKTYIDKKFDALATAILKIGE